MKPTKRQKEMIRRTLQNAVVAVRDIPNSALASFLPHLQEARNTLARDLKQWSINGGDTRYTAHRYRSALAQLDSALDAIDALGPEMTRTLSDGGARAAGAGVSAMERELAGLSAVSKGAIVPVSFDRAVVFAKGDKLLLKRYPRSSMKYSGSIRAKVTRQLSLGVLKQQTISQTANDMFDSMPSVFNSARFDASRLVRTEIMQSYNFHHHESLVMAHGDDDDIKMRWDGSFDFRRCRACADLDGRIIDVDGKFTARWTTATGLKKSSTAIHPPLHPNCRCVLVPWIDDWPDSDWNVTPPAIDNLSPKQRTSEKL